MTAILKVDTIQDTAGNNIINESSDTITIGASGDTVTVPGTEVKSNKLSPASGTALQIGDSGDTITIPSGATITNSGTATGFSGTNTPYFAATAASQSSLADNTSFKMNFTSEVVDSDGKYDAPNAKFTPTVAGWYWCYTRILFYNAQDEMRSQSNLAFYKNGSLWGNNNSNEYRNGGGLFYFVTPTKSELIYLDTDDYLEVYGRPNSVNGETATDGSGCFFSAFKLI